MESSGDFLREVFLAKGSDAGPAATVLRAIIIFVAAVIYVS